ncbi:MAG: nuclear transport factor 2 family protein [Halioglobus sp.]
MLSLQEISDRFEIQDLCYHYADVIDRKDFDTLRTEIFSDDAHIDYSAYGGSVGNLEDTIAFLKASLVDELFPNYQHSNANIQIKLDGDTATGRVMCFNPMEMSLSDGTSRTWFLGLWYNDEYSRTDLGWRISRRVEEKSWAFNTPDFMAM